MQQCPVSSGVFVRWSAFFHMLSKLNQDLEAGRATLGEESWNEWLWGSDPHAALCPNFNQCHLLGLLIARYRATFQPESMAVRLHDSLPMIVHGSKVISDLTLRQLRDVLEDLQMHWDLHMLDWDKALAVLDGLLARFGALNLVPQAHDDLASIEPETPLRMGNAAIRRFTVTFCVLYRHAHLEMTCVEHDTPCEPELSVQTYHVQAGLDIFYEHSMFADLPPAARLIYKQDFSGMYHCVTQVVYFHFPDYARKRQQSLDEIRAGGSPVNCLSVALELHPDIPVVMEDEMWHSGWNWMLVSGGKVYLIAPDRSVHRAQSLWTLMALTCESSSRHPRD
jgi:hypothetical protein